MPTLTEAQADTLLHCVRQAINADHQPLDRDTLKELRSLLSPLRRRSVVIHAGYTSPR